MDGMKLWQKLLLVLAVVALGFGLWYTFSGEKVHQPDRLTLIDVGTGDRYFVSTSGKRLAIIPERNPDTNERSLFPITKDAEGHWTISPLIRPAFDEYEGDKSAVVDQSTYEVKPSDSKPKELN
ncbi:MAG TPA: hypothetical protein ENK11_01380 [Phycisphaerales bacterium]|nr:hypothetical protein [Phycisphaerales bacterium]